MAKHGVKISTQLLEAALNPADTAETIKKLKMLANNINALQINF